STKVLGFVPTGWYPTAVPALRDGRLLVLNGKGMGSHPNPKGPNPFRWPAPGLKTEYVAGEEDGCAIVTFFGIAGGAVEVIVAPLSGKNDGSGGAYHYGCDFTSGGVLYLDATFANTTVDPLNLEVGLYVAE